MPLFRTKLVAPSCAGSFVPSERAARKRKQTMNHGLHLGIPIHKPPFSCCCGQCRLLFTGVRASQTRHSSPSDDDALLDRDIDFGLSQARDRQNGLGFGSMVKLGYLVWTTSSTSFTTQLLVLNSVYLKSRRFSGTLP